MTLTLPTHADHAPPPARIGLAGSVLADRYEIVELLGAGGMGEVYRARDRELDEIVAIKVLHPALASRADLLERFRREVKLARRVTHRAVARTFELGESGGIRFLSMEFVDGEPVARLLVREGRLSPPACLAIALDVCDALEAAHRMGIVHCDIKPDNIMLTREGRAVVTDFGIARWAADPSNEAAGTPAYMAPEQIRREPPTPKIDIHALGVMLFELATGSLPFGGAAPLAVMAARLSSDVPDPRSRVSDLDPALSAVILRATNADPAARFEDVASLRDALLAVGTRRSIAPWTSDIEATNPAPTPWTTIEVRTVDQVPDEEAHLAAALADEIALALSRLPLVRVVRSTLPGAGPDLVVLLRKLGRAARLSVSVESCDSGDVLWSARAAFRATTVIRLPVAVRAGVALALGLEDASMPPTRDSEEALQLGLQAQLHYRRPVASELRRAVELYEEALVRSPEDPRMLAGFAMAFIRYASMIDHSVSSLARAIEASGRAMALGHDRPEPHLAAGHVALHTGDPVAAATHFRRAIARAPAWPEAHEWVGLLLTEAGWVEDGRQRLLFALGLNPTHESLEWEIARLHALLGQWHQYDEIIDRLGRPGAPTRGRWLARVRHALWRGHRTVLEELRAQCTADGGRESGGYVDAVIACALEGGWPRCAGLVMQRALAEYPSRRRKVFYCQMAAELAALAGDPRAALTALKEGVRASLFDVVWLDRVPTLASIRHLPECAQLRSRVSDLGQQVFDALYLGDEDGS